MKMKKIPRQSQWLWNLAESVRRDRITENKEKVIIRKNMAKGALFIAAFMILSASLLFIQQKQEITGFASSTGTSNVILVRNGAAATNIYLQYDSKNGWMGSTTKDGNYKNMINFIDDLSPVGAGSVNKQLIADLNGKDLNNGLGIVREYVVINAWGGWFSQPDLIVYKSDGSTVPYTKDQLSGSSDSGFSTKKRDEAFSSLSTDALGGISAGSQPPPISPQVAAKPAQPPSTAAGSDNTVPQNAWYKLEYPGQTYVEYYSGCDSNTAMLCYTGDGGKTWWTTSFSNSPESIKQLASFGKLTNLVTKEVVQAPETVLPAASTNSEGMSAAPTTSPSEGRPPLAQYDLWIGNIWRYYKEESDGSLSYYDNGNWIPSTTFTNAADLKQKTAAKTYEGGVPYYEFTAATAVAGGNPSTDAKQKAILDLGLTDAGDNTYTKPNDNSVYTVMNNGIVFKFDNDKQAVYYRNPGDKEFTYLGPMDDKYLSSKMAAAGSSETPTTSTPQSTWYSAKATGLSEDVTYYGTGKLLEGGIVVGEKTKNKYIYYNGAFYPYESSTDGNTEYVTFNGQKYQMVNEGGKVYFVSPTTGNKYEKSDFFTWRNVGQMLNDAYNSAKAGRTLSILLGLTDNSWRRTMDEFFVHTVLGSVISGNWEESMCHHYIERPPEGTIYVIVPDSINMVGIGAHVEAERAESQFANQSGQQTEYFYKISIYVKNPEKPTKRGQSIVQDMNFNVFLHGQKTVQLFKNNIVVTPGKSFIKVGSSVIVQYSKTKYTSICIEFKDAVFTADGKEATEVCNSITSYKGEPTEYIQQAQAATATGTAAKGTEVNQI